MKEALVLAFLVLTACGASRSRTYDTDSNSTAIVAEHKECVLNEFEGVYTLDKCEGREGYFPIAVQQVNMSVSDGKLRVTYDTAHNHGDWNRGVQVLTRIFLDPAIQKQKASKNGCQIAGVMELLSTDHQSITMEPVSKVITLKSRIGKESVACTLKRIEK